MICLSLTAAASCNVFAICLPSQREVPSVVKAGSALSVYLAGSCLVPQQNWPCNLEVMYIYIHVYVYIYVRKIHQDVTNIIRRVHYCWHEISYNNLTRGRKNDQGSSLTYCTPITRVLAKNGIHWMESTCSRCVCVTFL